MLTMRKESFSFLASYKYGLFKLEFEFKPTEKNTSWPSSSSILNFTRTWSRGLTADTIFDASFPGDYFRWQLRLSRNTLTMLFKTILRPQLVNKTKDLLAWLCVTGKKILALGLYLLTQGDSYVTIGPNFNVGKTFVIGSSRCCWGIVWGIKCPSANRETLATQQMTTIVLKDLINIPNVEEGTDATYRLF